MINKKGIILILTLWTIVTMVAITFSRSEKVKRPQRVDFDLSVKTKQQNYLPGQVVTLNVNLTNKGNKNVTFQNNFDTNRNLKIFISPDGSDYKQYRGPRYGLDDSIGKLVTLKPKEELETQARVMWNSVPGEVDLKWRRRMNVPIKEVLSTYAFPQSGTYFLKVVFEVSIRGIGRTRIESQPTQVIIDIPTGENAVVWNEIKDNSEIARFIHEGDIKSNKNEKRAKVLDKVKHLLQTHPNSRYSEGLGQGLKKFEKREKSKAKAF